MIDYAGVAPSDEKIISYSFFTGLKNKNGKENLYIELSLMSEYPYLQQSALIACLNDENCQLNVKLKAATNRLLNISSETISIGHGLELSFLKKHENSDIFINYVGSEISRSLKWGNCLDVLSCMNKATLFSILKQYKSVMTLTSLSAILFVASEKIDSFSEIELREYNTELNKLSVAESGNVRAVYFLLTNAAPSKLAICVNDADVDPSLRSTIEYKIKK